MPADSPVVFPVEVTLSRLKRDATERVQLRAGTGALWTWVPAALLMRLGIRPIRVRRFRTVDQRIVERPYAEARIACRGRDCPSLVVFASEGDQNTLGNHALLGMGLEIDRETRSLREMDALPAYSVVA